LNVNFLFHFFLPSSAVYTLVAAFSIPILARDCCIDVRTEVEVKNV
jgi:hypothetical protein